jgi:HTH-type transcriptional regulator, transcriptional repressor of NAD biosynthesis genes
MTKRGIALGKFMPFHLGHKHLLDTARDNCDHLTIVVCSLPTEPIPGKDRFDWLCRAYPDSNVKVVHLARPDMPQEPADHINFWQIWREALLKYSKVPYDVLFSSEAYGHRLAEELSCRHCLVDQERTTVPTSGTAIRKDYLGNWEYLSNPAKDFFNKVVLVTGPESCGKTTMSENLAKHFDTTWAPEFAREYLETIGFDFTLDDLSNIANSQGQLIAQAKMLAEKVCFTDTCAVETHIYAQHYLERSTEVIRDWLQYQSTQVDLALLLTPEVKWVQDGLRNESANRNKLFRQFEGLLIEYKIPYKVVSSDSYSNRFKASVGFVNELLKGKACV